MINHFVKCIKIIFLTLKAIAYSVSPYRIPLDSDTQRHFEGIASLFTLKLFERIPLQRLQRKDENFNEFSFVASFGVFTSLHNDKMLEIGAKILIIIKII